MIFKLIFLIIFTFGATMANELQYEDSPYLKQHANNPIHWMAWGDKAFRKAKEEGKLIFLSIGYSTCHWCHVMEHESFEDEGVAKLMNEKFVSIKVDREEMPHVDKYYQDMHYLLQQRPGGWPLSIVMIPDRRVIFAATYLPKEDRGQMRGLKYILTLLDSKFKTDPKEIEKSAKSIQEAHERYQNHRVAPATVGMEVVDEFIKNVEKSFDTANKGIGHAPKFPHASTFDTLLDIYQIVGNKKALKMAKEALDAMGNGGIFDQIEGGFYRYSVDEEWQIPHFEKMLYTNAELLEAYSKLYSITHDKRYKNIVQNTIEAMNERFLKEGLYFSASDADSEGEEGKYFVFKYDEAKKALLDEDFNESEAKEVLEYFNISKTGNFEHKTTNPYILFDEIPTKLDEAKKVLKTLRQKVAYPFIDDKILTSWNSLFIKGLLEASEHVDSHYKEMALNSLDKLIATLHVKEKLYHQYLFNSTLKVEGLLEDFAFLSEALLTAYEVSFEKRYLILAKKFALMAKEKFYKNATWYLSDDTFTSKAELQDNAYKSAASSLMKTLATLALYDENIKLFDEATKMIAFYSGSIAKYPHAYPTALKAWLVLNKREILLKIPKNMSKEALKKVKTLNYPLLHVKITDEKLIQACEIQTCFSYGKNLDKVFDDIIKRVR